MLSSLNGQRIKYTPPSVKDTLISIPKPEDENPEIKDPAAKKLTEKLNRGSKRLNQAIPGEPIPNLGKMFKFFYKLYGGE